MSEIKLDWATAEVDHGKLTVSVEGSDAPGWRESFMQTVTLLQGGAGDWGEVKAKKRAVSIAGVEPGSEDKLRHFLESVVLQVNAGYDKANEESARDENAEGHELGPDGEMAARFRSFADPEAPNDETGRSARG